MRARLGAGAAAGAVVGPKVARAHASGGSQVMQGSAPVLNAQVFAVVTGPDGREARIQLLDNGLAGEGTRDAVAGRDCGVGNDL